MPRISLTLPANELCRVVDNAALFAGDYTDGRALMTLNNIGTFMVAADRYTAARDYAGGGIQENLTFPAVHRFLVEMEEMVATIKDVVRPVGKKPITLAYGQRGNWLSLIREGEELLDSIAVDTYEPESFWSVAESMFKLDPCEWVSQYVALAADRLKLLGRVKPAVKAPVDMWFTKAPHGELLVAKIGPTFNAVLKCLDREVVRESSGSDSLW